MSPAISAVLRTEILPSLGITTPCDCTGPDADHFPVLLRVSQSGCRYAVRVFAPGDQDALRREVMAMRAAAACGVPVPGIQAIHESDPYPALLIAWCSGSVLPDLLRQRPRKIWPLSVAFGEMLARLHAVSPPANSLLNPVNGWIDRMGPETRALRPFLERIAAHNRALLHLDYQPYNVLTDGARITTVLDWAGADLGDPRADVAWTIAILRLMSPDMSPAHRAVRRGFEWGFRTGYQRAAGPLRDMAAFYAWAWSAMAREYEQKLGRAEASWLRAADVQKMRRLSAAWMRRAMTAMTATARAEISGDVSPNRKRET